MAATESITRLSGLRDGLAETLAAFRAESGKVEAEFFQLLDEFRASRTRSDSASAERAKVAADAVQRLRGLEQSIAAQRSDFAGQHDQLSHEVGQLRDLADQQVQLLSAWMQTATKPDSPPRGESSPRDNSAAAGNQAKKPRKRRASRRRSPRKSSDDKEVRDVAKPPAERREAVTPVGAAGSK